MFDPILDERVVPVSESGCWVWTGWADRFGYGFVTRKLNGRKTHLRVHRLQIEMMISRNLKRSEIVCHKCDVPSCINPDHLFIGSHTDNMRDMAEKNRAARGEKHGSAKLTTETAVKIYLAKGLHKDIGAAFGVGRECVDKIKRGERWHHVTKNLTR